MPNGVKKLAKGNLQVFFLLFQITWNKTTRGWSLLWHTFLILKKCHNKLECFVNEMLYILKQSLNV